MTDYSKSSRDWSDEEKDAHTMIEQVIKAAEKGSRYRMLFLALQDTHEMDKLGPDKAQVFAHNEEWAGTPLELASIIIRCYLMYLVTKEIDAGTGMRALISVIEKEFDVSRPH
jgi:hypothetical protein